jgi:WXXGXW repeat (2 copies)
VDPEKVNAMGKRHVLYGLLCLMFLSFFSVTSQAQVAVGISVGFAPPALPVYEQPICPSEGYLWTPGYWDWDGDDYFWVPGTWVEPPEVGVLWTPGWWGWGGSAFLWHGGYWGPHVGWYGGISYGYGYFGHGYEGGRWDGDHFFYNRAANNINVTNIHNVYNTRIENNTTINRVSYNGHGGIDARATREEETYSNERHIQPVAAQTQHVQEARSNRELRASVNQGKPPIAATQRPGAFNDRATVVPAKEAGGRYEPPANRGAAAAPNTAANANRTYTHVNELPTRDRPPAPNTGNPKTDQKYQQQQQKLFAKQDQERQKMQAQQEKDHARLAQQSANEQAKQQVEQRHQQQTQQLQQRHDTQVQHLQQRQAPASHPSGGGGRKP